MIFSEFIKSSSLRNAPPGVSELAAVWAALRRALIHRLKQQALWSVPPSYLGVSGRSSWADRTALDELLADCYEFIFVDRQEALKAELERRENIDGLVFRNIGNFLYDLQKRHDPLGFRVFTTLRTAVRNAVSKQQLYVLKGNPRIANSTVLGFAPRADSIDEEQNDLGEVVKTWCDHLLPDLITANGKQRRTTLGALEGDLRALGQNGVRSFRFQRMIDVLKTDVRQRWSLMWDLEQGDKALESDTTGCRIPVRVATPDTRFEDLEALEQILDGVGERIEILEVPEKTRSYLRRLLRFLGAYAADGTADQRSDGGLPSRRKIAKRLAIPRDRLPELFTTLERLAEDHRSSTSDPGTLIRGEP